MLDFLYQLSDFSIFLFLSGLIIGVSIISILIGKRFIFHRLKYRDNATIASISSLIGIIYGVLAGFICLYLIDNNDRASEAALREANAVANVYRDSQWLRNPARNDIKLLLEGYIEKVIEVEWPLMREGRDSDVEGDYVIEKISNILKAYPATSASDTLIVQDVLAELKTLYNARHERISMSESQLSPQLWEVILIGTILIIGINYAFRVNFYLHLFAISAFGIMAAAMLFLMVTLDRPFQGEFIVEPHALQAVLRFVKTGNDEVPQQASKNPKHRHIHSFHKALGSNLSG
jgi:hypothetical protein